MKQFLFTLILLALFSTAHSQTLTVPQNCDLQALAIEAALGDPEAQYNLAVEFHQGEKVPQDLAKAADLWKMAAKGGVVSAYNNLGHLTYYGRGIKRNFAEGIRLWRIAAMKGHSESQVHLAFAYSDGKFLKKNYVEAFAWATAGKQIALRNNHPDMKKAVSEMAAEILAEIAPNLNTAQLTFARRRAALYISRYGRE